VEWWEKLNRWMKSAWNGWTWNEYGQQLKRNKWIISNRDSQERIEMRKKMVGTQHVGPSL